MLESRFNRINVPTIGADVANPNAQPVAVANADRCPLRVLVRNNGFGQVMYLSLDNGALLTLGDGIGSNIFELPAGASETFVIAPGQTLYVASTGNGTVASIAVSTALPADIGDERRFSP